MRAPTTASPNPDGASAAASSIIDSVTSSPPRVRMSPRRSQILRVCPSVDEQIISTLVITDTQGRRPAPSRYGALNANFASIGLATPGRRTSAVML